MVQAIPWVHRSRGATLLQFPAADLLPSPSQQTIPVPGSCTAILPIMHRRDLGSKFSKTRRKQTLSGILITLPLLPRRVCFVTLGRVIARPARPLASKPIPESDPLLMASFDRLCDYSSIISPSFLSMLDAGITIVPIGWE